jgi:hypothetical protein
VHERSLLIPKINLIAQSIRAVDNRLDGRVYNLSGVQQTFTSLGRLTLS